MLELNPGVAFTDDGPQLADRRLASAGLGASVWGG
jgi:hypothetical protein